eukprot:jgi/Ulvmu1/11711/UM008_0122.1
MAESREPRGIFGLIFGNRRHSEDGDALLRSAQQELRAESAEASHENPEPDLVLDLSTGAGGASASRDVEDANPETPRARTADDSAAPDGELAAEEEITKVSTASSVSEQGTASLHSAGSSLSSDASATCLICLDSLDPSDARNTVHLGCMCKGAAAYRHKACLDQWLNVKGDTKCDVCGAEMKVPLPPPPPVPGYVIFPDLEHTFETQWATFGRYVWQNAVAVVVYCVVLALIMDIPLQIAMLIAAFVLAMIVLRYGVSVAVNSIAGRTVLSFQVPESS